MRARSYLAWMCATAAALAALAVALTVSVDPYRMYGTPVVAGLTALKPRAFEQMGLAKTRQLERIAPKTLLLGNSRIEIGFDPESAGWPADAGPIFNAAEAGRSPFTALLLLREAMAVRPPETIVLGLDFLDFLNLGDAPPVPNADERRLLVDRFGQPNASRTLQSWQDRVATTLTIDAVLDSAATLTDQNAETSATMTPLGYNPLHEYRVFVAREGYASLFDQKNSIYRRQYSTYPQPDLAELLANPCYGYIASILQLAADHGTRQILVIQPYHAEFLDMLHELGLWPSFEAWKRAMVGAVEHARATTHGDIELFDFAGYDAFTTEPVPPRGDRRTPMQWYWEPGHYKKELGDHMLAAIFAEDGTFGRRLTPANVEQVLAEIRAARRHEPQAAQKP